MLDKDNFYLNLGKKIREERNKRDFSLEEFSEGSGLNLKKSTLSAIENGKQQISAFQLYLVAEALDLKISEIMKAIDTNNRDIKELNNL